MHKPDLLEQKRVLAIRLRQKGWTLLAVAHELGVHRVTVSRWVVRHQRGGLRSLKTKKALGAAIKLNWWQECSPLESVLKKIFRKEFTLVSVTHLHRALKKDAPLSRVTVWSALRKLWTSGDHHWEVSGTAHLTLRVRRHFRARYWSAGEGRSGIVLVRTDTQRYFALRYSGSKKNARAIIEELLSPR